MEIEQKYVAALNDGIVNATDVGYLGLTDAQFAAFLYVLAWYMGGKREGVDGFVVGAADTDARTLTVYWIAGDSIGSLTVAGTDVGNSALPPISGWLRSVRDVEKLALSGVVKIENVTNEKDVRPIVLIVFRGEQPIEISADRPNERARRQARDFIARLLVLIGGLPS
ncbi:hypothetical protein MMAN_04410 [Mycobacterium mantenii]|uniref:Uncharacterized protein n=1 Tax=Mycobacterium mantenii TaxID=560555 RepID=A0A1X0F6A1_MYCNT|nr:hypothetical protein [Mycobacterium mantenii]MCV7241173.1 hypothetical protein [Mycobacterium mantenii]ORA96927.1 hypothetical protein BST30_28025 [Mycobacterium mantenii]BBY36307.1 hypothetical protein MMAN_04410 [Mycobacterium mantenii]